MKVKVTIVSPDAFTKEELKQYEQRILDNKDVTELEASRFFTQFPKFLTIGGYYEIAREVVLYKSSDEPIFRVDFCRKKFGNSFWDFVELKSPKIPYVVRRGNHWKYSAHIEAGIHQSQDYREFLEKDLHRLQLEKHSGVRAFRPKILLIGGRTNITIDPLEVKRLVTRYHEIDIQTYDDIYDFALDNYKTSLIVIPIIQDWDITLPIDHIFELGEFVKHIIQQIVDSPEKVKVTAHEKESAFLLNVTCASEDYRQIVGRQSRTANAIRTIIDDAFSAKLNKQIIMEIPNEQSNAHYEFDF